MKKLKILVLSLSSLLSCHSGEDIHDASGTFEADEVIVSAELGGEIDSLNIQEGQILPAGKIVGVIDAENLKLQKEQAEASLNALAVRTTDVQPQVLLLKDQLAVQQVQLKSLLREKQRTENLVKLDAATGKQLDDINTQIEVTERQIQVIQQQIKVQQNEVATRNRTILSEREPMQKLIAQLGSQLNKAQVRNPISGTVLTKYAMTGEVTAPGKALYKIADLSTLTLRAYITGDQLTQVKIRQVVTVLVDNGQEEYIKLPGTITWVASKAEFTPKTIQTKDQRANLVYAVKIKVKNNGFLKIGMYGEVALNQAS
ncbi:HlyD family secretion protein [Adhaeribacter radiodurans]|uniref:HlyD family efflux transporter periplasmic adaptor subunit n=1 Tax=Adhaeribacter radiodurans TaxID=2745197 RepID=A0A7L7L5D1_9BACT|nr:HlyD family efflux transporter periplasmic adaptor subunit [Adhaeribacter radiodurans]QMU28012.1 HlyD family efflux transporter periplasmic adaptor subunit [Adhaeribacter radiodurans]